MRTLQRGRQGRPQRIKQRNMARLAPRCAFFEALADPFMLLSRALFDLSATSPSESTSGRRRMTPFRGRALLECPEGDGGGGTHLLLALVI